MKILFILGTRPDAIKLAPVIRLARNSKGIKAVVCATSQHKQMLYPVLKTFDIRADCDLNLMLPNQSLSDFTSRCFSKMGFLVKSVTPDWIVVQGDTTTSFVGAMVGFYNKVKVAHVEAGLRTYDKFSPFPEEINRVLISKLAKLHFAPTISAKKNLLKEGIPAANITVTGNTGIDALIYIKKRLTSVNDEALPLKVLRGIDFSKKIILITLHRRESFGGPFKEICLALRDIAEHFKETELIYPVHLNPNVRTPVFSILRDTKNIHLIEPLDYPVFVRLMMRSHFIITDSGGIQEEAPTLGKPVLVLRDVTERREGIRKGSARLIGRQRDDIFKAASNLLMDRNSYSKMSKASNVYGDGNASRIILKKIISRQ